MAQQSFWLSSTSAEKYIRPIEKCTVGFVFLGTPHYGSNLEAWASLGVGMMKMMTSHMTKRPNKELLAV